MSLSDSNVRSERIYVSLPPQIAKRVKALAKELGMSESKVLQLVVFEGFEAIDAPTSGHMFRDKGKQETDV